MSFFKKAENEASRVKMYIYGETGTGKTTTSLHFPSPAVIDTEKGTKHYGKYFDFHKFETDSINDVHDALDELISDPNGFKTFIVDSISDIYDSIKNSYRDHLRKRMGDLNYKLKPTDFGPIKDQVKLLMRKMLALDMNVIITARSKDAYSEEGFMEKVGTQAEGHKDMPYRFDIILELIVDENGKRIARVDKDRTNTLPPEFEFNYEVMTKYLDVKGLERKAVAFDQQEAFNKSQGRDTEVDLNGKKVYTAGILAGSLNKLKATTEKYGLTANQVKSYLRDVAGVSSFLDLSEEASGLVLDALNTDFGDTSETN